MNVKPVVIVVIVPLLILSGCATPPANTQTPTAIPPTSTTTPSAVPSPMETTGPRTFVLVPKTLNPYYDTANNGAQEAARELGVTVLYLGPVDYDATQQIQLINSLIAQKVDGLAISAGDADAMGPVGRSAIDAGIPVVSWNSAITGDGRILHIDPIEAQDLAEVECKMASDIAGPDGGQIAILDSASQPSSQGGWISGRMVQVLQKPEYAKLTLVDIVYGGEDDTKSYNAALGLLSSHPDLRVIICPTTIGIQSAARAVTDKDLIGRVFVTGLGTPNALRAYVKSGAIPQFALWKPDDLGYLAIYTLNALATGEITGEEDEAFKAGKLGSYTITDDLNSNGLRVYLGAPFIWNKDNIDSDYSNW